MGPSSDRTLRNSARGDMGEWPVVRMEASRGFLWRLSNTLVGYSTRKDRIPRPLDLWVYSDFCATREGSPETPNTKRSIAWDNSFLLGGSEGEGFTSV